MEVTSNESRGGFHPGAAIEEAESTIKHKFGQVRRRIKQIDLREKVVANPFAAVGIGLAVGALVGLIRPKPQAGRVTSALVTVAGALVYRLVRDAAIVQVSAFAKNWLHEQVAGRGGDTREPAVAAPF